MALWIDDIADFLEDSSVGIVTTDIFVGSLPDSPDDCVSLFQGGGSPPEIVAEVDYPSLQVRVRSKDYSSSLDKITLIQSLLHGVIEQSIGSSSFMAIKASQAPVPLGLDGSNRWEWTQNFNIMIRR